MIIDGTMYLIWQVVHNNDVVKTLMMDVDVYNHQKLKRKVLATYYSRMELDQLMMIKLKLL